jgi:hypothetical protein
LTIQAATTIGKALDNGSIAPAKAANAANGVAHANAKLARPQADVSSKRQNNGAMRASTGAGKRGQVWAVKIIEQHCHLLFQIGGLRRAFFSRPIRPCRDALPQFR